jgi:hypothetical protein
MMLCSSSLNRFLKQATLVSWAFQLGFQASKVGEGATMCAD